MGGIKLDGNREPVAILIGLIVSQGRAKGTKGEGRAFGKVQGTEVPPANGG